MARQVETYVEGLNEVLRALNKLPKEAAKELRDASQTIANNEMAPAWRNAALYGAGPWGEEIARSVKAGRDRLPKVTIGGNRRVFSGGASATMVRYPSNSGQAGNSFAPFKQTKWIERVRAYQPAALKLWGEAVDDVVAKWARL